MAVEYKTWLSEAERLGERGWVSLAYRLDCLGLSTGEVSKIVKGDVFIAGSGPRLPERFLVADPETNYRTLLRDNIRSLTLCDCDHNGNLLNNHKLINNWLEGHPIIIPALNRNYSLEQIPGKYRFFRCDVGSFLRRFDKALFDTIMIFCIYKIDEELSNNGLGVLIAEHLRYGGYVMGSGLFLKQVDLCLPGLKIDKLVELEKPYGTKNIYNLAFLARKPA